MTSQDCHDGGRKDFMKREACKRGWALAVGVLLIPGMAVAASQVELAGTFGQRAVLVIDGAAPRTVSVGESAPGGVRLLEVGNGSALVEVDGRRQRIALGDAPVRLGSSGGDGGESGSSGVSLHADSKGHHFANGSINGSSMRFLVDTGASMVSMGLSDARRAGIRYREGQPGMSQTASGPARVWKVRLDQVRIGDVTLHGVDGLVHENELPFVLLGMSFLSRMDMQREGSRLILRKLY